MPLIDPPQLECKSDRKALDTFSVQTKGCPYLGAKTRLPLTELGSLKETSGDPDPLSFLFSHETKEKGKSTHLVIPYGSNLLFSPRPQMKKKTTDPPQSPHMEDPRNW